MTEHNVELTDQPEGFEDLPPDAQKVVMEQNKLIHIWLLFFAAAAFRMPIVPFNIKIHREGNRLYVRAQYKIRPEIIEMNQEERLEERDLVLHNVPGFNFSPQSGIEMQDKEGTPYSPTEEWPPMDLIEVHRKKDEEIRRQIEASRQRIQMATPSQVAALGTGRNLPPKKRRPRG